YTKAGFEKEVFGRRKPPGPSVASVAGVEWDGCDIWNLFFRLCQFGQHTKILQCSGVAGDFCAARDLLEQSPHDFAAARFWERFGEAHFIWFRDGTNMRADVIAYFHLQFATGMDSCFQCHKRDNSLSF